MSHSSIKSNELKLSPNELKCLAKLIKTGEAENETKLATLKYLIMLQKELLITTKNTKPLNTRWGLFKHRLKNLQERRVSFLTEKVIVPVVSVGACLLIGFLCSITVASPMVAIASAACIGVLGLGLYKIVPVIFKKIFQCAKKGCEGSRKLTKIFSQSLECKDVMTEEAGHHFEVKKISVKKILRIKKLYDKLCKDASEHQATNSEDISKLLLEFNKHDELIKGRIGKYGVTHSKTEALVRDALTTLIDLNKSNSGKHSPNNVIGAIDIGEIPTVITPSTLTGTTSIECSSEVKIRGSGPRQYKTEIHPTLINFQLDI